jgi:hypothetical protein
MSGGRSGTSIALSVTVIRNVDLEGATLQSEPHAAPRPAGA